jgi:hypothetical protein
MADELNPKVIRDLQANFPAGEPLFMLNLLRFREKAKYPPEAVEAGISGKDAYFSHYLPSFTVAAAGKDIKPVWIGSVSGIVTGDDGEHWDMVAIIQYPSFNSFHEVSTSSAYLEKAERHRLAALENLKLIATTKAQMPA